MFCRYVLPYRIGNEKTSLWRKTFTVPSWVREAYDPNQDNSTYAYGMANDILEACVPSFIILRNSFPTPPHGTRTCQVGFLQGICTPVRGRTKGARTACHHRLHTTVGQPELGA